MRVETVVVVVPVADMEMPTLNSVFVHQTRFKHAAVSQGDGKGCQIEVLQRSLAPVAAVMMLAMAIAMAVGWEVEASGMRTIASVCALGK